jgi:hypothetical protein
MMLKSVAEKASCYLRFVQFSEAKKKQVIITEFVKTETYQYLLSYYRII